MVLKKKVVCSIFLAIFIISLVTPVFAAPQKSDSIKVISYLAKPDSPPGQSKPKPDKDAGASVDIRNIASGETLMGPVLVIAEVEGEFDTVVYQIDSGIEVPMFNVIDTNRYQANWDTTGLSVSHTISVNAKNEQGDVVGSDSADVTVVDTIQAVLFFEIDYLVGNMPTDAVLNYITGYWNSRAIDVTLKLDDTVDDPTPDGIISDSDFWSLESKYNDDEEAVEGDDRAYGVLNDGKFTLKEKWMLIGSYASSSNVGGSTWVLRDGSAGNYIFIADSMIDSWEQTNEIPDNGGEVTVLCHEMGHSIGILVTRGRRERYDPDRYSVMSTMTLENSKYMAKYWYYSKEYWATANLENYLIS